MNKFKCEVKRHGNVARVYLPINAVFAFEFADVKFPDPVNSISKKEIKERLKDIFCRQIDDMSFNLNSDSWEGLLPIELTE